MDEDPDSNRNDLMSNNQLVDDDGRASPIIASQDRDNYIRI